MSDNPPTDDLPSSLACDLVGLYTVLLDGATPEQQAAMHREIRSIAGALLNLLTVAPQEPSK